MRAVEVGLGKRLVGLGLREVGARLIEGVLERALVDAEQQVALLDDLTIAEVDLLQIAGYRDADRAAHRQHGH